MPKKQKQKQKQKQVSNQSTVVNVKVGETKAKRKPRAKAVESKRNVGTSLSVTLQNAGLSYPIPPIQQYNELVQQAENLRRSLANSGSLIPRMQTNDLLNRVQATNPFANVQTAIPVATVLRPQQGLEEQMVEGATTINPSDDNNFTARVPIDQDWIRNVAIANKAQTLGNDKEVKVGMVEDPESLDDLVSYDDQQLFNQRALEKEARQKELKEQMKDVVKRRKERDEFLREQEEVLANLERQQQGDLQQQGDFYITPLTKSRGRPKKINLEETLMVSDEETPVKRGRGRPKKIKEVTI